MKKTLCRLTILFLLTFVTSACATSRPTKPENASTQTPVSQKDTGQTLLFDSGVPASPADFLTQAQQADYILIGEQHTSAAHHNAQAAIITLLAENGLRPAIGLEMVPATLQPRLNLFNARQASIDELPALIDWAHVWGFDFTLYQPIFLAAEHYDAPVYGLNVSPDVIKSIREHNTPANIPADKQRELPPVIQYPTAIQREKLTRFFKQHASMLMAKKASPPALKENGRNAPPKPSSEVPSKVPSKASPETPSNTPSKTSSKMPPQISTAASPTPLKDSAKRPASNHGTKALQRFITIQSLWDSAMGYHATRIDHPGPKVILAGGAHVEYGHGIAYRIRHYEPEAKIIIVMPLPARGQKVLGQADFYYLEKP